MAKVVFAKNEVWPRKSKFHLRNSETLGLKISKLVGDGPKIFLGDDYLGLNPGRESLIWGYRRRELKLPPTQVG